LIIRLFGLVSNFKHFFPSSIIRLFNYSGLCLILDIFFLSSIIERRYRIRRLAFSARVTVAAKTESFWHRVSPAADQLHGATSQCRFKKCRLPKYICFSKMLTSKNINFKNVNFKNADFQNINLQNDDFKNIDFKNVDFKNIN
jgi:hypothetical protein